MRVTKRAVASLCGDWKALFGAKVVAERVAAPWFTPAAAETDAMIHSMCDAVYRGTATTKPPDLVDDDTVKYTTSKKGDQSGASSSFAGGHATSLATLATLAGATSLTVASKETPPLVPEVVFLIDGSGSVTNDDFDAMKGFVRRAGAIILDKHPAAKLGVVQFANFVHVERELTRCSGAIAAGNGAGTGTDEAGDVLGPAAAATARVAAAAAAVATTFGHFAVDATTAEATAAAALQEWTDVVGKCKLNPVDPYSF